mgnify:CR=1 FL=1
MRDDLQRMSNVTIGYNGITVELYKIEEEPFELIWRWYRETWEYLQQVEYDPTLDICQSAVQDVLNGVALPTPLESLGFEFRISGISRVALAQITRGRIGWAYNVLSQMPNMITHNVTIPMNIGTSEKYAARALELARLSQELYDDMVRDDIPPQDARYMTLHGQQTSLVASCNYASLKGFFMMRAESGLTDELNLVARLIRSVLLTWSKINKNKEWPQLVDRLDCLGAKQGKCLIQDKVFGATGRFLPGSKRVAVPQSESHRFPENPVADWDFTKSAWYLELLELPDDLLFPGEKEMIERWKRGGSLLPDESTLN